MLTILRRLPASVLLSLLAVYIIWGSTYFAIRVAVTAWPPLLLVGFRFILAGTLLFAFMRLRGAPVPTRQQWLHAGLVGLLLLGGGNGLVAVAEQWVSSSLAAAVVATSPLWVALFSGLTGHWPSKGEWLGISVGFLGVILLNLEGELRANPVGALALVGAPLCWALGSVLSRRLKLPAGPMASATEMLTSGAVLTALGLGLGQRVDLAAMTAPALGAWLYLVVFGSLVAFSAYVYLIRTVRPALALSYAYVNPVVALVLGLAFGGEKLTAIGLSGVGVILAGVVLITAAQAALPAAQPAGAPAAESAD